MVEPVEGEGNLLDNLLGGEEEAKDTIIQDSNYQEQLDDVPTLALPDHYPDNDMTNAIFFWILILAAMYVVYRNWDSIKAGLTRFVSSGNEEDQAMNLQKLSGGDDNSEVSESIGGRIMELAEASKHTIKKTLNKGKQTLKGAATTMQNVADRQKRKMKKDSDMIEDGELTLLNIVDDDPERLDNDDERPFQSFASSMQMQGYSGANGGAQESSYLKLSSDTGPEQSRIQMESMQSDLARIKDKELALDAENKILRSHIFQKKSSKAASSNTNKASDYHSLPGAYTPDTKSKAKVDTGYSQLASSDTGFGQQIQEENPVKFITDASQQPETTEEAPTIQEQPSYESPLKAAQQTSGWDKEADEQIAIDDDEIENMLADDIQL